MLGKRFLSKYAIDFKMFLFYFRSQPNMRQLGSAGHLESTKSYKSIDRDTPSIIIPRMMISQSAPHTPVSVPSHPDSFYKSVPRLLSEPNVGCRTKNSSPGVKSIDSKKSDRASPFILDNKKLDNLEVNLEGVESFKSFKSPNMCVPVHSPKNLTKRDSKFILKSPLVKRETKVQIENNCSKVDRKKSLDGTNV